MKLLLLLHFDSKTQRLLLLADDGFLQALGDLFDRRLLTEFFNFFFISQARQAESPGDLAFHTKGGCHFFFGQHQDLQNQVVALIRAACQSLLPHDDEAGEKDRFKRDAKIEQRKRKWIEMPDARNVQSIDEQP